MGLGILGAALAITMYVFHTRPDGISTSNAVNEAASQKDGVNVAMSEALSSESINNVGSQPTPRGDKKTKEAQPVVSAPRTVARSSTTQESPSAVTVSSETASNIEGNTGSSSPASGAPRERPRAWALNPATKAYGCTLETDHSYVKSGASSAVLRLSSTQATAFCGMIQGAAAGPFRGKRVEFSAYLSTQNVAIAALWFRADDAQGKVVAFDNQAHRPMRGVFPWTADDIVIDVPESAAVIAYGAQSSGTLWVDAMEFQIVDKIVPLTAAPTQITAVNPSQDLAHIRPAPENLDFEESVPIDP
jgi:hypothetical protein